MAEPAQDLFSVKSELYARARPTYPAALLRWIRGQAAGGGLCWDAGTGTGQVARLAADHFDRVFATDLSAAQVSHALPVANVTYAVEPAEDSSLETHSVDAVTVGAAAHWLDLPSFYEEVRRVSRPGGILALFSYGLNLDGESQLQAVIDRYASTVLAPWWSERLALVASGYRPLVLPFEELTVPSFTASSYGDLHALEDLLRTWSAAQQMAEATGGDPIDAIRDELHAAWTSTAPARVPRTLRWPTFARVGRVP